MLTEIRQRLAGVRRRQRLFRSIGWSVNGCLFGGVAALVLALLWRADLGPAWWTPFAAIGGSGAIAWLIGFAAPLPWQWTAAHVDEHCSLKDRSTTALQFAADDRDDLLRKLQVADAIDKLDGIDSRSVVPWQSPRRLLAAIGISGVVLLVMLMPIHRPVVAGIPIEEQRLRLEQADYLDETMLRDLRELAQQDNEELDELVKELEQLVDELRDPELDQRETLARLSMMQQAISASMAAFNLQQVDSVLQSLASSIEAAAAMQPVAADLRAQEYDQAAKKLEQLDPNRLSNKEKRTVAGNLKKLSADLEKARQGELSEATQEMAEGLEKKNDSKCKSGARKLARLCRKHALRKSVGQCLSNQLSRLSLCKSQCKNGCNGIAKSDRPSNNWGTGKTDKPLGDKATSLDSNREQMDVTGLQGDGPSEREVITSPEARQLAARGYQERYREFRKRAEAVLESEPLPLGHRQTVRQYFEKIRPIEADIE